jgi:hypothetical protein
MRRTWQVLVGVVAAGAVAGGVAVAASSPTVVTGGTSSVAQHSAVLHGTVNPNGSTTSYYFQWGLSAAYTASSATQPAGGGSRTVSVAVAAPELTPGTIYHYRLVASSQAGTSVGADRTFRTAGHPPAAVITGPVTQLSATGAELTGTINTEGQATTWYFQWGSPNNLSQQTTPQSLKAGHTPQNVGVSLQGLLNTGTIYEYRLVAVHQGSATTPGASAEFMTYPATRPYARVSATTRPRHRYRRPYVLTTSGSVAPAWIPPQYGCAGEVAVRFFHGDRRVRQTFVPLQSNCTFSASSTFPRLPRGRNIHPPVRLRVVVRLTSTPYLAPSQAPIEHVTLG